MSSQTNYPLDFAYAYGTPTSTAFYRVEIDDFSVRENLGFTPEGEGEHLYVHVKKRNQNTQWVAKEIAKFVGVSPRDVGFCGLKDRFAETSQWFSIYTPKKKAVDWSQFLIEGVSVITSTRHAFKLKPGMHEFNHFSITLRNIEYNDDLQIRLEKIKEGVPNYFGDQRFGIDGNNLLQAESLLIRRQPIKNKKLRGLIISAARSYLFNTVLSKRVESENWKTSISGEPEKFSSAPMWGRGRPLSFDQALEFESESLASLNELANGLEHVGLKQERRQLVCIPQTLTYSKEKNDQINSNFKESLTLTFSLPPGQYATSVLREIALIENYQYRT
ncbi:MAG: tRNA pseudouridine(13) synthase TruD [Cellvibrionaceae bacterium]